MLRPRTFRRTTLLMSAFLLLVVTILIASDARAADTQRPDGHVAVPAPDQALPGPGPFILSGTASDDVGVSRGDVAIRDRTSGRWLQPNGSWGPTSVWLRATLATPGARATTWTYSLSVPIGAYTVGFRAGDASRKFDASIPWLRFSVVAPPPPPPPPPPPATTDRPSVVLFLTDDQRWDSLWAMPNVLSLLGGHGVDVHERVRGRSAVLPEPGRHPEGRVLHTPRASTTTRGRTVRSTSSTTPRRWRPGCTTPGTGPR